MRFLSCLSLLVFCVTTSAWSIESSTNSQAPHFPDVNGVVAPMYQSGKISLIIYANPEMENELRDVLKRVNPLKTRNDFYLVRVVDFRGGIDPSVRGVVRQQVRKELNKELIKMQAQLKAGSKAETVTPETAPIFTDFSGTILKRMGWQETVEKVQFVIYDRNGHEVARGDTAQDPSAVSKALRKVL